MLFEFFIVCFFLGIFDCFFIVVFIVVMIEFGIKKVNNINIVMCMNGLFYIMYNGSC